MVLWAVCTHMCAHTSATGMVLPSGDAHTVVNLKVWTIAAWPTSGSLILDCTLLLRFFTGLLLLASSGRPCLLDERVGAVYWFKFLLCTSIYAWSFILCHLEMFGDSNLCNSFVKIFNQMYIGELRVLQCNWQHTQNAGVISVFSKNHQIRHSVSMTMFYKIK